MRHSTLFNVVDRELAVPPPSFGATAVVRACTSTTRSRAECRPGAHAGHHAGDLHAESSNTRERSAMLSNSIHLYHNRIHALFCSLFPPGPQPHFFQRTHRNHPHPLIPIIDSLFAPVSSRSVHQHNARTPYDDLATCLPPLLLLASGLSSASIMSHTPSPSPHYPAPPLPSFPSPPARTHLSSPPLFFSAAARRPAPAHPPSAAPSRRSQRGSGCSGSAATGTPPLFTSTTVHCMYAHAAGAEAPRTSSRSLGAACRGYATYYSTCTQCTLLISQSLLPLCAVYGVLHSSRSPTAAR